ncbi:uncharacterized protein DS421_20g699190 [Arachis hypogaea]|nr:uncharacterized protein DS421_20g699190 [Arachis hypogaea]
MSSFFFDIALQKASTTPKIGPRSPQKHEPRASLIRSRAGTCAYTQMCAYAHLLISPLVRTHRRLCVRTLGCVLLLCFLHVFSFIAYFLPLLSSHSCLLDLKSLTKHITASNGIKVELK